MKFYAFECAWMVPIRLFIFCCVLLSSIQSDFYCYRIETPLKILVVILYILPIFQVIIAVIIFVFSVYFICKTQTEFSSNTQKILARHSIIGIIGLTSFLGKAVSNRLGATEEIGRNLFVYLSAYPLNDAVSVLRTCVVLILSIKTLWN